MKIPVTLTLDDPAAAESLDNVSVSIVLTQIQAERRAPPSRCRVACPARRRIRRRGHAEGTLEVRSRPRSWFPVELGAFADGFVAVTGGKLAEGDTVVVAK